MGRILSNAGGPLVPASGSCPECASASRAWQPCRTGWARAPWKGLQGYDGPRHGRRPERPVHHHL